MRLLEKNNKGPYRKRASTYGESEGETEKVGERWREGKEGIK